LRENTSPSIRILLGAYAKQAILKAFLMKLIYPLQETQLFLIYMDYEFIA